MKTAICLVFLAPLSFTFACLWDRDTLADEAKLRPEIFDVITGQVPHHGDAYYEARIKQLAGKTDQDDDPFLARNDLAVAYIRIREFDKAHEILTRNLAEKPGDYFTISNLGVLEKKRGNYSAAAEHIEKALSIRSEGHLGIGDWYLKMIEFRAATE
ncbi:MAG: tetratricopeptide repeat protein, partial [Verrucomicrobiota bacterium]